MERREKWRGKRETKGGEGRKKGKEKGSKMRQRKEEERRKRRQKKGGKKGKGKKPEEKRGEREGKKRKGKRGEKKEQKNGETVKGRGEKPKGEKQKKYCDKLTLHCACAAPWAVRCHGRPHTVGSLCRTASWPPLHAQFYLPYGIMAVCSCAFPSTSTLLTFCARAMFRAEP